MPNLPHKLKPWPDDAVACSPTEIQHLYEYGHQGAYHDDAAEGELHDYMRAHGMNPSGESVAHQHGFADAGKGKLTILFPAVTQLYGYEALTNPAQETGDCVSMGMRDSSLHMVCIDALSQTPDATTGKLEEAPKVSEKARHNGVFANEPFYLARGHSGQGMSCDQALHWAMKEGGVVIRQKYPEADLESYNVSFEKPGSRGVPDWLDKIGREHAIRDSTEIEGHEASRDFLDRGNPLFICSGLGFSSRRDENGFSKRSGSWSHSWHVVGYDDRPWAYETYGHPLALFGHRWGQWNEGPRRIHGTDIDIPHGYCWFDARLLKQCEIYAINSVTGWARKPLPNWLGDPNKPLEGQ